MVVSGTLVGGLLFVFLLRMEKQKRSVTIVTDRFCV